MKLNKVHLLALVFTFLVFCFANTNSAKLKNFESVFKSLGKVALKNLFENKIDADHAIQNLADHLNNEDEIDNEDGLEDWLDGEEDYDIDDDLSIDDNFEGLDDDEDENDDDDEAETDDDEDPAKSSDTETPSIKTGDGSGSSPLNAPDLTFTPPSKWEGLKVIDKRSKKDAGYNGTERFCCVYVSQKNGSPKFVSLADKSKEVEGSDKSRKEDKSKNF